jgi:2-polyprenyl-3-methyl-5-hydroxy-6-metoxy-1,4-benzoquinol methylase
MAVPSECPLCRADNDKQNTESRHVWGGTPSQAIYRCEGCDAVYLYPRMTEKKDRQFYLTEFEDFMAERAGPGGLWHESEKHVNKNEPERVRRMKDLEDLLPEKGGRILEIGCSSGFMLFPLAEMGYSVFGVEPSVQFRAYIEGRGINCYSWVDDLISSGNAEQGFDLILHYGVLEHIADPYPFLRQQYDLLKPNGTLLMEAPNVDDALISVFDIPELEQFYWVLAHCWYYSRKSFSYLLEELGWPHEIRLQQRYDLSNHLAWAQNRKPGGAGSFTSVLGKEIEQQYKSALISAGISDTVLGIVTKEFV